MESEKVRLETREVVAGEGARRKGSLAAAVLAKVVARGAISPSYWIGFVRGLIDCFFFKGLFFGSFSFSSLV